MRIKPNVLPDTLCTSHWIKLKLLVHFAIFIKILISFGCIVLLLSGPYLTVIEKNKLFIYLFLTFWKPIHLSNKKHLNLSWPNIFFTIFSFVVLQWKFNCAFTTLWNLYRLKKSNSLKKKGLQRGQGKRRNDWLRPMSHTCMSWLEVRKERWSLLH